MRGISGILATITLLVLVACGEQRPPDEEERRDLGNFHLNVNFAFADKATTISGGREATPEEWVAAVTGAVAERLGRYDGSHPYDMGISVEGYVLAPPGVPVIFSPRSVLVANVNLLDPVTKTYLAKARQFQIIETLDSDAALVGSGNARDPSEQLGSLAYSLARQVEIWLANQHAEKDWFTSREEPSG